MRINSLAMRIWFAISAFIGLIIIVFLSFFALVLKEKDEKGSRHLFEFIHAVVLNDLKGKTLNVSLFNSIEEERISHFVYNQQNGQVTYITGQKSRKDEVIIQSGMSMVDKQEHSFYSKRIGRGSYLIQFSRIDNQSVLYSYTALAFNEDMKQIIIAGLLIILFSVPNAILLANNISKPLRLLEGYTKRIANKEWDSELHIKRYDEVGRLAESMQEMKEALRMVDEEERKFLQSISQDLKTPVMIITSYAQAIIDGMYEGTPEEPSRIIKAEAVRLEKKIKQILYLNTLDYMLGYDKRDKDVRLDKLLAYLVVNFQSVNVELAWDVQIRHKPALISGNPDRIRVSIENVLENQLRYARNKVSVTLNDAGSCWEIEIINDGPLLSKEELNQLFLSMYKGEKGNFGLGLNITSKIVEFYGGMTSVKNHQGLVCFTLQFPKKLR
jgi:two-component system sensor histidine kinase CssS